MKTNHPFQDKFEKPVFEAPKDYFESLNIRLQKIPELERKRKRRNRLQLAVAASMLLVFSAIGYSVLNGSSEGGNLDLLEFQVESNEVAYYDFLLPELEEEDWESIEYDLEPSEWEEEWLNNQESFSN